MPPETTAQPARSPRENHRGAAPPAPERTRRIFRHKVMVDAASPFPAQPVRKRPRWWIRLRGLIGMSIITVILGVLLALAVGAVLAFLAVWMVTSLT